jgi:beta-N-acetylhexosaminidase
MDKSIDSVGQMLLFSFHGIQQPSPEILDSIRKYKPAGFTLFRPMNIGTLEQVRNLTEILQQHAREQGLPPFLICTDQEGGQLMAVGDCTPLPGNMALGATGSAELAYKAGMVLGRELAALGINVDYAPSADVNVNPENPVIGTRSFGDDPQLVGELAVALVLGIQSQGVVATVKHFPGHGDTQTDSHMGIPVLTHDMNRLRAVELPPFAAAIQAGVKMVMTAHVGIEVIDGKNPLPATLSPRIVTSLLRQEMGFAGVVVSDAMNMQAIRQGELLREDALFATLAGIDLLLLSDDPEDHKRVYESLSDAVNQDILKSDILSNSVARIMDLKKWLSSQTVIPDLSVIRCAEHKAVADEIAERAVTLVQDRKSLLPLQLAADKRIAVIVPEPQDLTPADTSSYIKPDLALAIRAFHPQVDGFSVSFAPDQEERSLLLSKLQPYDLIIMGTINAYTSPNQAALVHELIKTEIPTIVIAMRLPYDLKAFPQVGTYLCTYSILEPSLRAAAKALFGKIEITGKLPVKIKSIGDG